MEALPSRLWERLTVTSIKTSSTWVPACLTKGLDPDSWAPESTFLTQLYCQEHMPRTALPTGPPCSS